jgi:hypothetical protein
LRWAVFVVVEGAGGGGVGENLGLGGGEVEEGGEAVAVTGDEVADLSGEGEEGGLGEVKGEGSKLDGSVEAHDPGGGALVDAFVIGHDDDFFPGFELFDGGAEGAGEVAIPGGEVEGEVSGLFFEPLAGLEAEAATGVVEDMEGFGDLEWRCDGGVHGGVDQAWAVGGTGGGS